MLGSLEDADDALQETLLRAWRGLPRFERRSSVRTWLHRIATNCCLQLIGRRPRRALAADHSAPAAAHTPPGKPLSETVWIEPYPDTELAALDTSSAPAARYDQRESVELAFVASLQHLPARQRAVLLLRDVLDYSAREAADLLETSVPSVNSALQRARQTTAERVPAETQQSTLRSLGDARARQLVGSYIDAIEHADMDALLALVTEDIAWAMPPASTWYRGLDTVVPFLLEYPFRDRWRHLPTRVSGQLAAACYLWDPERNDFAGAVIDVLTLRGDRIAEVTGFFTVEFGRFGLPERLPAGC